LKILVLNFDEISCEVVLDFQSHTIYFLSKNRVKV